VFLDALVADIRARSGSIAHAFLRENIQGAAEALDAAGLPLVWLRAALEEAGASRGLGLFCFRTQELRSGLGPHLTDEGNARRLVALHGAELRHCAALGWLVWDGRRWLEDDTGEILRRARATVASLWSEAGLLRRIARFGRTDEERDALLDGAARLGEWAHRSEGAGRLFAMARLAQSEAGIQVRPHELDADLWLFNVANGTIDLRTGDLRPHRREDLLTRVSAVEYTPGARLQRWDDFLDAVTAGDGSLQAYVQRAAGYSLVGAPSEEVLFLAHGPGASGKSTLVEAIKATMGEYAATADFETFLKRPTSGSPRNDIARLAGRRMVVAIEADEGGQLAPALVKTVTGGDTVTARKLYREFFEFVPSFTLWLVANHAPEVDADDDAMWRRIRLLPFEHVVPEAERDPAVKATLRDPAVAGPAILAWAVEGCLIWQREGLGLPAGVGAATAAYRAGMDTMGDFFDEHCTFGPDEWVSATDLHGRYEEWAKANRAYPLLTKRMLAPRWRKRGAQPAKGTGGIRIWRGIGLRPRSQVTPPRPVAPLAPRHHRLAPLANPQVGMAREATVARVARLPGELRRGQVEIRSLTTDAPASLQLQATGTATGATDADELSPWLRPFETDGEADDGALLDQFAEALRADVEADAPRNATDAHGGGPVVKEET
jgi:putative DNA primase/helicase